MHARHGSGRLAGWALPARPVGSPTSGSLGTAELLPSPPLLPPPPSAPLPPSLLVVLRLLPPLPLLLPPKDGATEATPSPPSTPVGPTPHRRCSGSPPLLPPSPAPDSPAAAPCCCRNDPSALPPPLPPPLPYAAALGTARAECTPARGVPRRLLSLGVSRALRGVEPALPCAWLASSTAPCCGRTRAVGRREESHASAGSCYAGMPCARRDTQQTYHAPMQPPSDMLYAQSARPPLASRLART